MFGVHKVTIRWIKQGRIGAVRFGREFRVPEDEVKRLLKGKLADTLIDIASGLKERRVLKKLLDYVVNGKIDVVISHKDRLTRFGFRYLEEFFNSHGVRIEVVFGEESRLQQELIEDLIAVVTFAGRLYGMRSHKKKKVVESVKQAIRCQTNSKV